MNQFAPFLSAAPLNMASPEHTLRELQALLDNAGAGIVFIRERQVVRCNARFAQLFGYASAAELIGQRSESFSLGRAAYRDLGRAAFPVIAAGTALHHRTRNAAAGRPAFLGPPHRQPDQYGRASGRGRLGH
ncbi:MAG: PAS domain-containing protein [Simplicispira sp.]|nr:PAS domain-containing protein [Simplicispira sp.]